ncbi:MAG: hypothetical protein ACYTFK_09390 [Planctomycetota bacterium]|jgi:hypothetical protein
MEHSSNQNKTERNFDKAGLASERILRQNPARLAEFRTHTVIAEVEEPGEKVVYKYASAKEAIPFLKLIADREKENVAYLKDHFDVLCGELNGDRIEYKYLPCQSLQDNMAQHLRQGNYDIANELFESYVSKLRSLERTRVVPEEFLRSIAAETDDNNSQMDCLARGLLDLTPRNIFIDGNRWIVIDNEWSFDFPVPVIFLLFRTIREMSIMLQPEIRKNTRTENPAAGLFSRKFSTFFTPVAWSKHITDTGVSLSRLLLWECGLQKFVTGEDDHSWLGRIKPNYKTRTHFPVRKIPGDKNHITRLKKLLKKVPGVRQIAGFLDRKTLHRQK